MKRPLTDHEYQINGGAWIGCTLSNTTNNGDGTYTITDGLGVSIPIGSLKVRVKAIDINPFSAALTNAAAFNAPIGGDTPLFYMNPVKTMAVGDADQLLGFVSSSAGAVTFVSSDTSKATIVVTGGNSYLHAVASGDVTVTANQAADAGYAAVDDDCIGTVVSATTVDDITYSTVALGKAATANGSSFNVADSNTYALRKYLMVAGKAIYQKTIPSTVLTTSKAVKEIIYSESLGVMPASPIVDVDSSYALFHRNKFRNIGSTTVLDNNIAQFEGFKNYHDHGTVTITRLSSISVQVDFVNAYGDGYGAFADCLFDRMIPAGAWIMAADVRLLPGDSGKSIYVGNALDGSGSSYLSYALTDVDQTVTFPLFENDVDTNGSYGPIFSASLTGVSTTLSVIISNLRMIPGTVAGSVSDLISDLTFSKGTFNAPDGIGADLSFKFANVNASGNGLLSSQGITTPGATLTYSLKMRHTDAQYTVLISNQGLGSFVYFESEALAYIGTIFSSVNQNTYDYYDNNWFVLTLSYNGTEVCLYINGFLVTKAAGSFGNTIFNYVLLLGADDNGFASYADVSTITLWNSKLSNADIKTSTHLIKQRMRLKNHFVLSDNQPFFYVSEGDSITQVKHSWQYLYRNSYTPQLIGSYPAQSGAALGAPGDVLPNNTLYARQAWVNQSISEGVDAGKKVVLSVLIGTNDMGARLVNSGAVAAYYASLCDYVATARALGAKVALCTILDIQNVGFMPEANRPYLNELNDLIRGDATKYDALIDFNADPAFSTATTTYYNGDLVHPNPTGYAKMYDIAKPVLDALLTI